MVKRVDLFFTIGERTFLMMYSFLSTSLVWLRGCAYTEPYNYDPAELSQQMGGWSWTRSLPASLPSLATVLLFIPFDPLSPPPFLFHTTPNKLSACSSSQSSSHRHASFTYIHFNSYSDPLPLSSSRARLQTSCALFLLIRASRILRMKANFSAASKTTTHNLPFPHMEVPLLPKHATRGAASTAAASTGHDLETCRIWVYPFGSTTGRFRPIGIRRRVPEFLKSTVETDRWQQVWDDIDQSIGNNDKISRRSRLELLLSFILINLGAWCAGWLQFWTYLFLFDDVLESIWENPVLAIVYGCLIEAFLMFHLVRRLSTLAAKQDKILRNLVSKVRYVCDDFNNADGATIMYLHARPNYDLALITVDVYKSQPPPDVIGIRTTSSKRSTESCPEPLDTV